MCFYGDETAEVYHSKIRRSRKSHRCDCCGSVILLGEIYEYGSGIFDGDPFCFKSCGSCELLRWLIHVYELADGCRQYESWAPMDEELFEAAKDRGIEIPSKECGQRWLTYRTKQMLYRATH